MYPKERFWVHIEHYMYMKWLFFIHIGWNVLRKSEFLYML